MIYLRISGFLCCIYEVPNLLVKVYAEGFEILDQVECGYVLHATVYVSVEHVNLYTWCAGRDSNP